MIYKQSLKLYKSKYANLNTILSIIYNQLFKFGFMFNSFV